MIAKWQDDSDDEKQKNVPKPVENAEKVAPKQSNSNEKEPKH